MSAQRRYLLAGAFVLAVVVAWTGYSVARRGAFTRAGMADLTVIKAGADRLRATVVTPHLECRIGRGRNVLWCATFQVAWNELCEVCGDSIRLLDKPEAAGILNKRTVTRADLSDANCVALGGWTTDDANDIRLRITSELDRKFGAAANPKLLSLLNPLPAGVPVGYAYLLGDLPFEWAFQRWRRDFSFAGREVEYFGIYQFASFQEDEARAAGQVLVYDHKGPDDFILELKTRSKSDRLILAKIPPARTLVETIAAVQSRLQRSEPASIRECSHLFIPVIDFEVLRNYHELCPPLTIAAQQTRFKLDERGAVLESEAVAVAARVDTNLIFDKPFLVMIQRTDASRPYFALWVANAELLVPLRRR